MAVYSVASTDETMVDTMDTGSAACWAGQMDVMKVGQSAAHLAGSLAARSAARSVASTDVTTVATMDSYSAVRWVVWKAASMAVTKEVLLDALMAVHSVASTDETMADMMDASMAARWAALTDTT